MNRILLQLHHDYPGASFSFDRQGNYLIVNEKPRYLSLSMEELDSIDLFTSAGKNYYQALVNLLYMDLDLLPGEGTVAEQLIVKKEDARRYRLQVLASKMQLGFLEGDDGSGEAFALEIEDGEHPVFSEIEFQEPEEELEELEVVDDRSDE